jgi:hypothetical protein
LNVGKKIQLDESFVREPLQKLWEPEKLNAGCYLTHVNSNHDLVGNNVPSELTYGSCFSTNNVLHLKVSANESGLTEPESFDEGALAGT